jgi:acyl-CoA reductase-like NAD-dependent aldehyde dehydrogenase
VDTTNTTAAPSPTPTSSNDVSAASSSAIRDLTPEVAEHWIDGGWIGSDTVSESINPATGEVLAEGMFESTTAGVTLRYAAGQALTGTIWSNAWAELNDGFAEGGYEQSGVGRLRGPLAITEFQEAKTVVHSIAPLQA